VTVLLDQFDYSKKSQQNPPHPKKKKIKDVYKFDVKPSQVKNLQ
jgi:hypothetical protein